MRVYAVILNKYNLVYPMAEDVLALEMTKEKGVRGGEAARWRLDKVGDVHHPFHSYLYYHEKAAAFAFTGKHLDQGPGRIWLFRSRKKAETFREGFFAYKIFIGACFSGDDSRV